jgi:uncharacterized membrane protein
LAEVANETPTTEETPKDAGSKSQVNTMALLSYLGPLCLVPLLTGEKDEFAKFHLRQGMVLFIGEAILWVVFYIFLGAMGWSWGTWGLYSLLSTVESLAYLGLGVLSVVGIVNVVNGQQKELPVVGKFAGKITFVK